MPLRTPAFWLLSLFTLFAYPVQAGVMAVMAVADTAKFTVERLKRRVF